MTSPQPREDQTRGAGTPSAERWRTVRTFQRRHREALTRQAAALYPQAVRVAGTSLLTAPEWLPSTPLPLSRLHVHPLDEDRSGDPLAALAAPLMPWCDGRRTRTYAEALAAVERPRLLENRPTYRLTGADLTTDPPWMRIGRGRYFDVLDVGEAAAHEYTTRRRQSTHPPQLADLPLRAAVGDPRDPTRRPILPAITTLTIRHDQTSGDARFLVHWRDPAKVATNGGAYQLAPVGIFQPANAADHRWRADLDPWRCMAREYAEELLGSPELDTIDYHRWPFYQELERARADGGCRPYLLGIGVDPLTLATDLLTAVVFDAPVFDQLFAHLVTDNDEGQIETRDPSTLLGNPFTDHEVHTLATDSGMQAAGAATLHLAWHHRQQLLPQ